MVEALAAVEAVVAVEVSMAEVEAVVLVSWHLFALPRFCFCYSFLNSFFF